jgi:hypothetical protein
MLPDVGHLKLAGGHSVPWFDGTECEPSFIG